MAVLLLAAGLAVLHGGLFKPRTPTGFHAVPDALNRAAVAVLTGIDLTRLALLMLRRSGCWPCSSWRAGTMSTTTRP